MLNPTYRSRCEDFKRIFKDLPVDERLIVDYSCALQRDILLQGRIYVTQNYLCFYANIFRWETLVFILSIFFSLLRCIFIFKKVFLSILLQIFTAVYTRCLILSVIIYFQFVRDIFINIAATLSPSLRIIASFIFCCMKLIIIHFHFIKALFSGN